jgi:hypothetical protein
VHQAYLLGAGDDLQPQAHPLADAAQEITSIGALPHRAGRHRPETCDGKVLHPQGDLGQPVDGRRRRNGVNPPVGEHPVAEADGKAFLGDDAVALIVLELDRDKTDGIRAEVDGRDTQRGELYCGSSWR